MMKLSRDALGPADTTTAPASSIPADNDVMRVAVQTETIPMPITPTPSVIGIRGNSRPHRRNFTVEKAIAVDGSSSLNIPSSSPLSPKAEPEQEVRFYDQPVVTRPGVTQAPAAVNALKEVDSVVRAQSLTSSTGHAVLNLLPLSTGYNATKIQTMVPQGMPLVVFQLLQQCVDVCSNPTARAQFEAGFRQNIWQALQPAFPDLKQESILILNVMGIRGGTVVQLALIPNKVEISPLDLVRELQKQLGDKSSILFKGEFTKALDPETFGVDIST